MYPLETFLIYGVFLYISFFLLFLLYPGLFETRRRDRAEPVRSRQEEQRNCGGFSKGDSAAEILRVREKLVAKL